MADPRCCWKCTEHGRWNLHLIVEHCDLSPICTEPKGHPEPHHLIVPGGNEYPDAAKLQAYADEQAARVRSLQELASCAPSYVHEESGDCPAIRPGDSRSFMSDEISCPRCIDRIKGKLDRTDQRDGEQLIDEAFYCIPPLTNHADYDPKRPARAAFDFTATTVRVTDRLSDEAFRDECAMRAMAAMIDRTRADGHEDKAALAHDAFLYSDAMVAERGRR